MVTAAARRGRGCCLNCLGGQVQVTIAIRNVPQSVSGVFVVVVLLLLQLYTAPPATCTSVDRITITMQALRSHYGTTHAGSIGTPRLALGNARRGVTALAAAAVRIAVAMVRPATRSLFLAGRTIARWQ